MNNLSGYSMDAIVFIANENRKSSNKKISIDQILEEVCDIFEQSPEMIKSSCRRRKYLFCRYIIGYVSYLVVKNSLNEIAEYLGCRHHTTVLESNKKVRAWIKDREPAFMEYWDEYTTKSSIWNIYLKQ